MTLRDTWTAQCEAARDVLDELGTAKALGYLVGEKLLNFLEFAEGDPEWRAEIPGFVAEIKGIFEPWQLAEYLDTPRRLGALPDSSAALCHSRTAASGALPPFTR